MTRQHPDMYFRRRIAVLLGLVQSACDGGQHLGWDVDGSFDASDAQVDTPEAALRLVLTPADTLVAVSGLAVPQRLTFHASVVDEGGNTVSSGPISFSTDNPSVGEIDPSSGAYSFSGNGGVAHVTASVSDGVRMLSAQAVLTVDWAADVFGAGVSVDAPGLFVHADNTAPDGSLNITYPLGGALMPRDVAPPDVQWSGTAAGVPRTVYRIRLQRPHAVFTAYSQGASDLPVDTAAWSRLAGSDLNAPITISVVAAGAMGIQTAPNTSIRTADSIAGGRVAYSENSNLGTGVAHDTQSAVRIDVERGTADYILSGPSTAQEFSPSHDGRSLLAAFVGGWRTAPGSCYLYDTSGSIAVPLSPFPCGQFSPDDSVVLAGSGGSESIVSVATGHALTAVSGVELPFGWSPNGRRIAFALPGAAELAISEVSPTYSVGPATRFGSGVAVSGGAPSWSPDSMNLVIASGAAGSETLLMVSPATGRSVEMTRAESGSNSNYGPTYAPFNSGGIQWVAFSSRRRYGNSVADGLAAQIWVTAVHVPWDGTTDPSEVPFWLAGQDSTQDNRNPQWTAAPCGPSGSACSVSSQCCSGLCQPGDAGAQCADVPSQCRTRGESCSSSSDCCMNFTLTCTAAHVCDVPPPP